LFRYRRMPAEGRLYVLLLLLGGYLRAVSATDVMIFTKKWR